jgi:deoxycytidylate deaminase
LKDIKMNTNKKTKSSKPQTKAKTDKPSPKTQTVMPPRIVIGLTGPVGSGCSTIASFFDDSNSVNRTSGNKFLQKMAHNNYLKLIKDEYTINWDYMNSRVDERLKEYGTLKNRLQSPDKCTNVSTTKIECRRVYKELGRLLELRESLKAYPFLKPYYKGKTYENGKHIHLFRNLSMSDLIIFHSLSAIESSGESGNSRFDDMAKMAIKNILVKIKLDKNINETIKTIGEYYTTITSAEKQTDKKSLIRAFKIIHEESRELKRNLQNTIEGNYPGILQDFGDNIRNCGCPFGCPTSKDSTSNSTTLVRDMASIIKLIYDCREGAFFVIDCLRNPYEALYLRKIFPDFYLISTYADPTIRFERIYKNRLSVEGESLNCKNAKSDFEKADRRDSGKIIKENIERVYKQNVTKCVQISDFAINNNENRLDGEAIIHEKIMRMLALILSPGACKPTLDEVFMNMAYTMAVKSNCICRQVGTVIKGADGYIVGAGWNDIARGEVSCGLTAIRDLNNSSVHRPLLSALSESNDWPKEDIAKNEQFCFCFKDEKAKKEIPQKVANELEKTDDNDLIEHKEKLYDVVRNVDLHQLEFCRALHAEENAIIQSAKIGGASIKNASIYTTAQPCTLCAKKIKQSGIRTVIFTDPYPKSLPDIFMSSIHLKQFEGVKPRSYMKLFMANHNQKEWQDMQANDKIPGFCFNDENYLYPVG